MGETVTGGGRESDGGESRAYLVIFDLVGALVCVPNVTRLGVDIGVRVGP